MNREIKFRFWDKENTQLIPHGDSDYKVDITDRLRLWYLKETHYEGGGDIHTKYDWEMVDCEVMQYTGLKDKNGKEIYEGDIVSVMTDDWSVTEGWSEDDPRWRDYTLDHWTQIETHRDYVTLESFRYWLKNESFGYEGEDVISPEDCIIIGNIYENSDLLTPPH